MENLVSRLQDEYDEDQFNGGSGMVLGGLDDGDGLLRGNSDPEVMFRITRSGRRVYKAESKAQAGQVASMSAQKAVKPPPKPKKSAKDILRPPNLGYGRTVAPRVGEKCRRRDYDDELNNLVNVQLDFEDSDGVVQLDFEDLDGVYQASTPGSEASSFSYSDIPGPFKRPKLEPSPPSPPQSSCPSSPPSSPPLSPPMYMAMLAALDGSINDPEVQEVLSSLGEEERVSILEDLEGHRNSQDVSQNAIPTASEVPNRMETLYHASSSYLGTLPKDQESFPPLSINPDPVLPVFTEGSSAPAPKTKTGKHGSNRRSRKGGRRNKTAAQHSETRKDAKEAGRDVESYQASSGFDVRSDTNLGSKGWQGKLIPDWKNEKIRQLWKKGKDGELGQIVQDFMKIPYNDINDQVPTHVRDCIGRLFLCRSFRGEAIKQIIKDFERECEELVKSCKPFPESSFEANLRGLHWFSILRFDRNNKKV
ncbi:hypothetical protein OF83DRAFT_1172761 [Amylostereum chailletii]|nr:hypothetical protein OF83DRAFT_1172761 [Amylostereum chailletii]